MNETTEHDVHVEHVGHYAEPNEATNWKITCRTCGWTRHRYGLSYAQRVADEHVGARRGARPA